MCKDDKWVGVGRYERNDDRLSFTFDAVTHDGEVLKDPQPIVMKLVSTGGNEIALSVEGYDVIFKWQRRMPAADATPH